MHLQHAMGRLGMKHHCTGDSSYGQHIQSALDGLAEGTYKTIVEAADALQVSYIFCEMPPK